MSDTAFRETLDRREEDSSRLFDQAVLLIATGGLGVSATVLGLLLRAGVVPPLWPFLICWGSLGAACLSVVWSHQQSRETMRRAIDIHNQIEERGPDVDSSRLWARMQRIPQGRRVELLNKASAIMLTAGIAAFVVVLGMSLKMAQEKPKEGVPKPSEVVRPAPGDDLHKRGHQLPKPPAPRPKPKDDKSCISEDARCLVTHRSKSLA